MPPLEGSSTYKKFDTTVTPCNHPEHKPEVHGMLNPANRTCPGCGKITFSIPTSEPKKKP